MEDARKKIANSVTQRYAENTTTATVDQETGVSTTTQRKNVGTGPMGTVNKETNAISSTLNKEEKPPPQETAQNGENNKEEWIAEYETKLEQIVTAVKEGLKSQNNFLSSTMGENNQEQQSVTRKWGQQLNMQMPQAQQTPMRYSQNIPQFMMPATPP